MHPVYMIHANMIQRCMNPNHPSYKDYGARGITVCDRWLGKQGFANFLADMGERPEGVGLGGKSLYTLERKDNNLGYSPDNCIWATRKVQASNKRATSRRVGNLCVSIASEQKLVKMLDYYKAESLGDLLDAIIDEHYNIMLRESSKSA